MLVVTNFYFHRNNILVNIKLAKLSALVHLWYNKYLTCFHCMIFLLCNSQNNKQGSPKGFLIVQWYLLFFMSINLPQIILVVFYFFLQSIN